jgi:plastocyanin
MKRSAALVLPFFAAGLMTLHALGGASIEGTVQLPKVTPVSINPARYKNKIIGEIGKPDPPMAVVYLEGNFPKAAATRGEPGAHMQQQHFQFAPGILPIQVGTAVDFPNLDEGYHNVFSFSKPKRFDLGRYRKDEKPAALVFDQPGVVKLYCEIHEHMRGTILVLNTPYFVKTDAAGKYRLENLPAGKFKLKAWVDDKTVREREVELQEGAGTQVDFPAR